LRLPLTEKPPDNRSIKTVNAQCFHSELESSGVSMERYRRQDQ
jgi:hypothetical protein